MGKKLKRKKYAKKWSATLDSSDLEVRIRESIPRDPAAPPKLIFDWAISSTKAKNRLDPTDPARAKAKIEEIAARPKFAKHVICTYSLTVSDQFKRMGIEPDSKNSQLRFCRQPRTGTPYVLIHPTDESRGKSKSAPKRSSEIDL